MDVLVGGLNAWMHLTDNGPEWCNGFGCVGSREQVRDLRATMRSTVQKNLGTRDDEVRMMNKTLLAGD